MPVHTQSRTNQFLKWTEKYTQTDMHYLAQGGFWLGLKTVITMLVALALSAAFANLLPQATYGEYKYIFSLFGFLALPTLLGMGTAVTKSVAQGFEGTPARALHTKIQWGLIGSLGAIVIAGYYLFNGNVRLAEAFTLVAIFLPFVDSLTLFNSILTGKKLFNVSTIIELIIQTVPAAGIMLVLYISDNLLFVIFTYFALNTAVRFVAWNYTRDNFVSNKEIDASAISYGKHLSLMQVPSVIAEALESMLLWQFLGPAALAIYAFSKGIPSQISNALQRLTTLAFPKFAQKDFHETKEKLTAKMLKMLLFMLVIVGAYILAAPLIFQTIFPQYMDSVLYSQIFALTLLFFPQKFIGTLFQAQGKTTALYISNTVVPFVRIGLLVLLVPFYGIAGALISELGTRTVNLVLVSYLYTQER